jgi:hypothetical protein
MKLQEVIDNLDNTISGKEELLSKIESGLINQFIQINLSELRRIREDLLKVKKAQETS